LLDVKQIVENQGVSAPKSHRKATEKDTEKHQSIENQALDGILFGFSVFRKNVYPKPNPPVGTFFAGKKPDISIHFSTTEKTEKQKTKNKENH